MKVAQVKRVIYILISLNAVNAMALDLILPALPQISEDFNVSNSVAQLSLIVFYFGTVLSRVLWGPITDSMGRRKVLLFAMTLQLASQIACAFAGGIKMLILFRIIQSIGSGVTGVVMVSMIADIFRGKTRARFFSFIEFSTAMAIMLGPVIGSFISSYFSWRGCFGFMSLMMLINLIVFFNTLPETNVSNNKIKDNFYSYKQIFSDLKFMRLALIPGMFIGSYMMFSIHSPFFYINKYNFTLAQYSLFQMLPLFFSLLSGILYRKLIEKVSVNILLNWALNIYILWALIAFALGLKLIAVTPNITLAMMIVVCSLIPISIPGIINQAMDFYPSLRGSSAGVISAFRTLGVCLCMTVSSVSFKNENSIFMCCFCASLMVVSLYFLPYMNLKRKFAFNA